MCGPSGEDAWGPRFGNKLPLIVEVEASEFIDLDITLPMEVCSQEVIVANTVADEYGSVEDLAVPGWCPEDRNVTRTESRAYQVSNARRM